MFVVMLENGQNLYIWLGRDLAPHYLQALFGVDDLQHIDPRQVPFPYILFQYRDRQRLA
jgi:hypothetical protein